MPTFELNTIRSLASRVLGMALSRQHSPRCLMASRTRAVRHREELDLPFGDQPLQQFIRGTSQVHPLGVRPDQDVVGLEDQVHRFGGKLFLLLQAERRQALGGALGVDAINERQPLQRMHARRWVQSTPYCGNKVPIRVICRPCSSRAKGCGPISSSCIAG